MSSPNLKPWLIFISLFFSQLAFSSVNLDSRLTPSELELIKNSPFSITAGPSLVVRTKHVKSVRFFQSTHDSKYGFQGEAGGLLPQSLWVKLSSTRHSICGAQLYFSEPFDIRPYNSVVFWVRATHPIEKLWLAVWDNPHHRKGESPGLRRSKAFKNGLVQVVVPLSWISAPKPVDFSSLERISLFFDGASEGTDVQIEGLAFVAQPKPLASAYMFAVGSRPRHIHKESLNTIDSEHEVAANHPVIHPAEGPSAASHPELILGAVANPLEQCVNIGNPEGPKGFASKKAVLPPLGVSHPLKNWVNWNDALMGLILFVLSLFWWMIRHWHTPQQELSGGKLFLEAKWPSFNVDMAPNPFADKEFWVRKKAEFPLTVWLSPFQAVIDPNNDDKIYGESFLRQQIKLAHDAGVPLIPSLCFVRTIFRFETFISNPKLYLMKTLANNENVLSDEELRSRHVGYFPLWIPPYWQKKHHLSQRILVAYGRMPGYATTSDSVQYNLGSAEFLHMITNTLERFAKVSTGVRIEGAAALLSNNLSRFWAGHFDDERTFSTKEIWKEVVATVKKDHPHFQFFADESGPDAKTLLDMGFDYVENNYLVKALTNQIRQEHLGVLTQSLESTRLDVLKKSVFNLSDLFSRSTSESFTREQNLLVASILSLLPGLVQHDGNVPGDFSKALNFINNRSVFKDGRFTLLPSSSDQVLAFARWQGRSLLVAAANFSFKKKEISLDLTSLLSGFAPGKLYLFNDLFHGMELFKASSWDPSSAPAVAVLGRDLMESGFPLLLSELSLRLFSVSLSRPIPHEIPTHIRELHQA